MKLKELHQEIDTMSDNKEQQKQKRLPTVNERKMERERGRGKTSIDSLLQFMFIHNHFSGELICTATHPWAPAQRPGKQAGFKQRRT